MDKRCRVCGASELDVAVRAWWWVVNFQEWTCSRCSAWYQAVWTRVHYG